MIKVVYDRNYMDGKCTEVMRENQYARYKTAPHPQANRRRGAGPEQQQLIVFYTFQSSISPIFISLEVTSTGPNFLVR